MLSARQVCLVHCKVTHTHTRTGGGIWHLDTVKHYLGLAQQHVKNIYKTCRASHNSALDVTCWYSEI